MIKLAKDKSKKKDKTKKNKEYPKANLVQLGSKPPQTRLVWICTTVKDGKEIVGSGITHEGLRKAIARGNVKAVQVVDIKKEKVIDVTVFLDDFIETWKNNYLNPKWGYKGISKLDI